MSQPGQDAERLLPWLLVARTRPILRRLTLGSGHDQRMSCELPLPLFEVLLDRLPNLDRLELHGSFRGAATHPTLRELKYGRPRKASRLDIADWRLPRLETLHLLNPGRVDWSRIELPRLERLLLDWDGHGDELVASLARAPLLRQLRSLVLVGSELSSRGIRAMLDNAEAFAGLDHVLVLGARTNSEDGAQLRKPLPNVLLGRLASSIPQYTELTSFGDSGRPGGCRARRVAARRAPRSRARSCARSRRSTWPRRVLTEIESPTG